MTRKDDLQGGPAFPQTSFLFPQDTFVHDGCKPPTTAELKGGLYVFDVYYQASLNGLCAASELDPQSLGDYRDIANRAANIAMAAMKVRRELFEAC